MKKKMNVTSQTIIYPSNWQPVQYATTGVTINNVSASELLNVLNNSLYNIKISKYVPILYVIITDFGLQYSTVSYRLSAMQHVFSSLCISCLQDI